MKKNICLLIISISIVSLMSCNITLGTPNTDGGGSGGTNPPNTDGGGSGGTNPPSFTLTADSFFGTGDEALVEYGLKLGNAASTLSFPNLKWSNVPTGTQSLLLVLYDRHTSSVDWGHGIWVINDPAYTEIPKETGTNNGSNILHANISTSNTKIDAVEVYYAPAPPLTHGYHNYMFKIYATSLAPNALKTAADNYKRGGNFKYSGGDRMTAIEDDATIKAAILETASLPFKYKGN